MAVPVYTVAIRGAQKGLDVLLVESERIGGVRLNHGCVPAKTLVPRYRE